MSRIAARVSALTIVVSAACTTDLPTDATEAKGKPATAISPTLAAAVRELATSKGFSALSSPAPVRPNLVRLGRLLAFDGTLEGTDLANAIGTSATTVAAIVMYDDDTESAPKQANYIVTVNGVVQPGGGG